MFKPIHIVGGYAAHRKLCVIDPGNLEWPQVMKIQHAVIIHRDDTILDLPSGFEVILHSACMVHLRLLPDINGQEMMNNYFSQ